MSIKKKFGNRFQSKYSGIVVTFFITFVFIACSNVIEPTPEITNESAIQTTKLNIWWEQGYNLEEDEAVRNIVNRWQSKTGQQVKLSFFSTDELTAKAKRAVEAGNVPDILMNPKGDRILYLQLAWQDKLEDVSDLIEPIKDDYPEQVLKAVTYSNSKQGKRSYYAVPIEQIGIFIFYWQDLLASIGFNANDIPRDWNDFWQFWQQAQTTLTANKNTNTKALGLSLGKSSSADDTYYLFEQILEAYDLSLFNQQGELGVDRFEVRQGIVKCLNWYAQLYQQSYIPSDATNWSNVDNNRNLLNRLVLMTPNTTFSIPATVSRDRDTYLNRLGVVDFPNKPNGKPMRHLISVRQAVIFQNSPHKALAKDFLGYFIQPQIALDYFKASNSRTQPVRTSVWSDSFWQNTQYPYIAVASEVLTSKPTRLFDMVNYPAYSQVLAENVWGKALTQVTADRISPEQAADEAISRIQNIFTKWQQ